MTWDEYLLMLDQRIKECEVSTKNAHKIYIAETSKLKAAMETKAMYEKLIEDGKL